MQIICKVEKTRTAVPGTWTTRRAVPGTG